MDIAGHKSRQALTQPQAWNSTMECDIPNAYGRVRRSSGGPLHGFTARRSRTAKGEHVRAMIRKVSAKPTIEHAVGGCGYDFDRAWGVSRKPTVEHDVGGCDGVVEITFTVHTQAATFVSSTAAKREASPEWIAEHRDLSSQLHAYESLRE